MTNHGDERPNEPAPQRCTIGELSEQVGMTVRNIRAYQARGLLPPPIVDGRVGYYTQAHRERLTMIRRLRAEGFNLVAISALLTGVVPVTTSPAEPGAGGTELSDAGAALLGLGVPVDAVLQLHREVGEAVDQVAAAYARLFEAHVRGPWLDAGSPRAERHRVLEAASALPPIATAAVTATLLPAVHRLVRSESLDAQQSQPQR
jgi:DNA-binding transcriptional MerR regulator